jgi:quercetin dioxygenase-like cupin family protein
MDLTSVRLFRWADIPREPVTPMLSRQLISGERVMVAQIRLRRGCVVPRHSHEAEQLSWVFSGALKFFIAGETITVHPGEVLSIPSWVEHEAVALEETHEVDVFSPIRRDWLDGTAAYFHAAPTQPADRVRAATAANPATLLRWRDTAIEPQTDYILRAYLTGDRTTIAQIALRKGAVVPSHAHESEQLTWVRSGRLQLTVGDQVVTVGAGAVLRVPSGLPHQAIALADTRVLDLFSPRRDDWLGKTDHYFRQGNPAR